jgi:outer membrane receptor protein involved in Fe transport
MATASAPPSRVGPAPSSNPINVNVRHLLAATVMLAAVAAAPTARAQASETQPSSGPTILAASAAVRPNLRMDASIPRALDVRQQLRRSETLMIVGGAILLAGAIIGGDAGTIIMIGGAGIGIYGLYLYLQ